MESSHTKNTLSQTTESSYPFLTRLLHILIRLLYYFCNLKKQNKITHKLHSALKSLSWGTFLPLIFSLLSRAHMQTPPPPPHSPPARRSFCHSLLHLNTALCLSNRDLSRKQTESTTILLRFTTNLLLFFFFFLFPHPFFFFSSALRDCGREGEECGKGAVEGWQGGCGFF